MTLILIALAILAADAIFFWQLRAAQQNLADTTRLFENIVARQIDTAATENAEHRREVDKLLTRIQAPEAASFMDAKVGPQHIDTEDDPAYWRAIKDQIERG